MDRGGNQLEADLFWSDPQGASANDYDLYVVDSTGQYVVASSTNPQNGTQNPYESVGAVAKSDYLVVVLYAGSARFLHLCTGRGELSISTQSSTRGHDCATNAFDVAALNAYKPHGGSPDTIRRSCGARGLQSRGSGKYSFKSTAFSSAP